jgi:hypothetical protein
MKIFFKYFSSTPLRSFAAKRNIKIELRYSAFGMKNCRSGGNYVTGFPHTPQILYCLYKVECILCVVLHMKVKYYHLPMCVFYRTMCLFY